MCVQSIIGTVLIDCTHTHLASWKLDTHTVHSMRSAWVCTTRPCVCIVSTRTPLLRYTLESVKLAVICIVHCTWTSSSQNCRRWSWYVACTITPKIGWECIWLPIAHTAPLNYEQPVKNMYTCICYIHVMSTLTLHPISYIPYAWYSCTFMPIAMDVEHFVF